MLNLGSGAGRRQASTAWGTFGLAPSPERARLSGMMPSRPPIRALDDLTISRIAAGEVVERPASVVKELIENSIDAEADDIRVEIVAGGRRSIRVSDNGSGIPADQVELAFARHTTSKLRRAEDLTKITSLGFRGEALAAIAAVCEVTVVTRTATEPTGVRLRLQNGRVVAREAVGAPVGTVLTAENLFHAVPARLKFMRSETTEAGHVLQVVSRYALAYPDKRFRLIRDGRSTFASPGSGTLADVFAALYGPDVAAQMIGLEDLASEDDLGAQPTAVRVGGLVCPPQLHRASRAHVTLLVNGRWVQDAALTTAVIQAYHTMLPTGRYPVALLIVELPADQIDVNIHPAKTEVRFRDPQAVFNAVQRVVRRAVTGASPVPRWGGELPGSTSGGTWPSRPTGRWPGATLCEQGAEAATGSYQAQASLAGAGELALPILRVIGQVGRMYIVAEGPEGMYVIDQHAAHERVLYERLRGRDRPPNRQPLLMPEVVHLGAEEYQVVSQHIAAFAGMGFELELFSPDAVVLRAVPEGLPTVQLATLLRNAIDGAREGQDALSLAFEERLLRAVCKQAAIKAGQILDMQEMRHLVRELERCAAPATCPHGRPTRIVLDASRLAREFRRL